MKGRAGEKGGGALLKQIGVEKVDEEDEGDDDDGEGMKVKGSPSEFSYPQNQDDEISNLDPPPTFPRRGA